MEKNERKNIYVIVSGREIKDVDILNLYQFNYKETYIVSNPQLNKVPFRYLTPRQMMNYYDKRKWEGFTFSQIVDMLDMREVNYIYDKSWLHIGNFRWICSVALGISKQKKIFIMPWMSKCELDYQEYRLNKICDAIINMNGLVVIPVEDICGSKIIERKDVVTQVI